MDITARNFNESLELIKTAISESSFISIDGEFTGLLSDSAFSINALDTAEERYHKLRKGALDFLLFQFGLCAFQYIEDEDKYLIKPFNFYIFPRPLNRESHDVRFLCQSGSIDFLAAQGFDFNKVFKEGISFLTPLDEEKQKNIIRDKYQQLNEKQKETGVVNTPITVPDEHKSFIESTIALIENLLTSDAESVELPQCNGFLRKILYQLAASKFEGKILLETTFDEKKQHHFKASRIAGPEDVKKKTEAKMQQELNEISDAVGFTKIVKHIAESGKLVVGHNMILDLLHLVNRFWCPLPESYADFKGLVGTVCPRIIDTKVMASNQPFREYFPSTGLADLYKGLQSKPFVSTPIEFAQNFPAYTSGTDKLHEAGYDAFITGNCFAIMMKHLASLQKTPSRFLKVDAPLLQPYVNKLFLMKINDIPYMNLAGKDITPNRDHVFHVTFPADWKTNDIQQLFLPFGGGFVSWVDNTSAFVALNKPDAIKQAGKKLIGARNNGCKIIKYANYIKQKANNSKLKHLETKTSKYHWTADTKSKNGQGHEKNNTNNDLIKTVAFDVTSDESFNADDVKIKSCSSVEDIDKQAASCCLDESEQIHVDDTEECNEDKEAVSEEEEQRKKRKLYPTSSEPVAKRYSADKQEKLFDEVDNW